MNIASAIAGRENAGGQWRPRLQLTPGLVIRCLLSVGLLAAAFWFSSDKLDWRQLSNLDLTTLAACAGLSLLMIWLLAWRWRRVAASISGNEPAGPGIGAFLRNTWICLAANQVLPSIVGGDALRVALLSRQGVSLGGAVGSVILDRAFGLVGLSVLTGASAFLLAPSLAVPAVGVAATVVAGVGISALGWRLFADRLKAIIPANALTWSTSVIIVALAIVAHLANIAIFLVVAYALGVELPIFAAVAVMCAVLLIGVLPVSVAGWGVRELALVQAFGHMGLPPDKVLLSSVTYGLVLFIVQAPGFLLLARRNRP